MVPRSFWERLLIYPIDLRKWTQIKPGQEKLDPGDQASHLLLIQMSSCPDLDQIVFESMVKKQDDGGTWIPRLFKSVKTCV